MAALGVPLEHHWIGTDGHIDVNLSQNDEIENEQMSVLEPRSDRNRVSSDAVPTGDNSNSDLGEHDTLPDAVIGHES